MAIACFEAGVSPCYLERRRAAVSDMNPQDLAEFKRVLQVQIARGL